MLSVLGPCIIIGVAAQKWQLLNQGRYLSKEGRTVALDIRIKYTKANKLHRMFLPHFCLWMLLEWHFNI
ncbi:hypothetical protein S83_069274 [Arachis hypogaea]